MVYSSKCLEIFFSKGIELGRTYINVMSNSKPLKEADNLFIFIVMFSHSPVRFEPFIFSPILDVFAWTIDIEDLSACGCVSIFVCLSCTSQHVLTPRAFEHHFILRARKKSS